MIQPTYQKFCAKSPQFADVGKAMHDAWFHSTAAHSNRNELFTNNDIGNLLQYMWHEIQHERANVEDEKQKVRELKEEIQILKGGK